jgi:RecG-like helicase
MSALVRDGGGRAPRLLAAAANGYQGALLAPTEILAEQHYRGLSALLAPFGLKVILLTGSQRPGAHRRAHRAGDRRGGGRYRHTRADPEA